MRTACVYYRIEPTHAAECARCVDALLAAMTSCCTIPPRRLRRCGDADTWMELYQGIADWTAFERTLERETRLSGVDRYAAGGRHLECFTPFAGV